MCRNVKKKQNWPFVFSVPMTVNRKCGSLTGYQKHWLNFY